MPIDETKLLKTKSGSTAQGTGKTQSGHLSVFWLMPTFKENNSSTQNREFSFLLASMSISRISKSENGPKVNFGRSRPTRKYTCIKSVS